MASASSAAAPDAPAWALLVPFASLALVLCIWAVASRLILLRSLAHIPGPAHSFARGALGALHRLPSLHDRRHACLRALHATYGRVVKVVLPFGAGAVVLCSRCAAVREDVLVKYTAFPHRPATLDLPLGLASLRLDAKYAACRAALARALSVEVLQAHHAGLCACADQLCEQLVRPPQQPESGIPAKSRARHDGVQQSEDPVEAAWDFKVSAPVAEVVFEALLLLFFGEGGVGQRATLFEASRLLAHGMAISAHWPAPLLEVLDSFPPFLRPAFRQDAKRALETLKHFAGSAYESAIAELEREVVEAPAEAETRDSYGAVLKAAADSKAVSVIQTLARLRVPREAACELALSALLHAHQTTSNTICWVLHLLARHPEDQELLRSELTQVTEGGALPHFPELTKRPHFLAVWLEALRLFPTVSSLERVAMRSTEVDGVAIPVGTVLCYSIAAAARDESVFGESVERFQPSRHLDPTADSEQGLEIAKARWLPYGGGARRCAGVRLAEQLGLSFLAAIVSKFELSEPLDAARRLPSETTGESSTLGPSVAEGGLSVRLMRRTATS